MRWFIVAALLLAPDARVKLDVLNGVSSAPANLHVRVRIQASPDNRLLVLDLEGSDFYRRSDFQIDGDRRVFDWWPRDIPCGDYEARANLVYWDPVKREWAQALDRRTLKVVGMACNDPGSLTKP